MAPHIHEQSRGCVHLRRTGETEELSAAHLRRAEAAGPARCQLSVC